MRNRAIPYGRHGDGDRTRECLQGDESFVAVLEVCGFNDWLIRMLRDYRCYKVILIQPEERKRRKTDRRDAAALSELFGSTARFLQGKPVRGLWQVDIASTPSQETGRLTMLRQNAGSARTRLRKIAKCSELPQIGVSPPCLDASVSSSNGS